MQDHVPVHNDGLVDAVGKLGEKLRRGVLGVALQTSPGLSLEAHRTWFSPRDVRCTTEALATRTGGRAVSIGEALAADIVCVHGRAITIAPVALRRGTHVNVLGDPNCIDSELLALATVVDAASLPAMAAGFIDGRQLDELTVFRYQP